MGKLLTAENFKCDRHCGECCKKMLVQVNKEEINRIEKLGHKDFIFEDHFNESRFFLKKDEKGWCIFLKKEKDGKYACSIYKNRPKICQQYPFFNKGEKVESCLPEDLYPNVFFKFPAKTRQEAINF